MRIWNTESTKLIADLEGHMDSVYTVSFTPDGKGLVSGSLDNTLKHWDMNTLFDEETTDEEREAKCPCIITYTGHKVGCCFVFHIQCKCMALIGL